MVEDREVLASLRAEYQEMCKLDAAVRDFRAKLLAALPVVSGAALALLLRVDTAEAGWTLVAAGFFGAAVTFGFFIFERQGQEVCKGLVNTGRIVEEDIGCRGGVFRDRPVLQEEPWRATSIRSLVGAQPATRPKPHPAEPQQSEENKIRRRFDIELSVPFAARLVYGATFLAWVSLAIYGVAAMIADAL